MIRVGIIGCGKIAQVRHLPEYAANPNAEIVAFYDKNAWQVRVAYNWRDEFLNGIGGGGTQKNARESFTSM